jgi:Fur family transcriptional regulator, ferric uptake regulator
VSRTRGREEHDIHARIALLLAAREQLYTPARRTLIEALAQAGRPATLGELLTVTPGLAASTAYRNLTVLSEAGIITRVSGADQFGRFELSEQLSGQHHHHIICSDCGLVLDTSASPRREAALAETARTLSRASGFDITDHRIELVGRCTSCR